MKKATAYLLNHEGTNEEIGRRLGEWIKSVPEGEKWLDIPVDIFPKKDGRKIEEMYKIYDKFCPGINEEISSFSEAIGTDAEKIFFYLISFMNAGCNVMGVRPERNIDGHTILAYTYDFTDTLEEMCLAGTAVKNKYRYAGSQCNVFGRSNGINEHGLAMCQSSNGVPVTNVEGMGLDAKVTGLTFWCVIRSLLENCRDIYEALEYLKDMPIAYNMNLMMGDKSGDVVLFENQDGFKLHKIVSSSDDQGCIFASNHAVLPEMLDIEKQRWNCSVIRYRKIRELFLSKEKIKKDDIKQLISKKYPDGLCTHYYGMEYMFGMLYSGILDPNELTIDVVFGSPEYNPWRKFEIDKKIDESEFEIILPYEEAPDGFYEMTDELP